MARLDFVNEGSPDIDGELLRSIRARRGGQLLNLALSLAMASLTFGWLFRKAVEP